MKIIWISAIQILEITERKIRQEFACNIDNWNAASPDTGFSKSIHRSVFRVCGTTKRIHFLGLCVLNRRRKEDRRTESIRECACRPRRCCCRAHESVRRKAGRKIEREGIRRKRGTKRNRDRKWERERRDLSSAATYPLDLLSRLPSVFLFSRLLLLSRYTKAKQGQKKTRSSVRLARANMHRERNYTAGASS